MEQLFRRYYEPLCRYVYGILGDKNAVLTEDVVQEVFLKLWKNKTQIQINTSLKAYLYQAARNTALNAIQKEKRHQQLETVYMTGRKQSEMKTEEELLLNETRQKLQAGLSQLPPKCREVFQLSRFEELSYKEIAQTLNISVKTVENQMGKALKLLRDFFYN